MTDGEREGDWSQQKQRRGEEDEQLQAAKGCCTQFSTLMTAFSVMKRHWPPETERVE
jgi:hypothetical protein